MRPTARMMCRPAARQPARPPARRVAYVPTRPRVAALALLPLIAGPAAMAQSFFNVEHGAPALRSDGRPDAAASLRAHSMLAIELPPPKEFRVHDLVTILIDEVSRAESSQSLETQKDFELEGALEQFPSIRHLLEAQLETGDSNPVVEVGARGEHESTNEGEFRRSDRFTARLTAEIIDVKPNGTIVLEAKKAISNNKGELQSIVLSGVCRQEDISEDNTVSSANIADLRIFQRTEGEVHKGGTKGLIPRVLETIFNF